MRGDHPDLPITADELARDAQAVVKAGAQALHIHPRDASGKQTMGPLQVSSAIKAVREAVPKTPVGVTTIATIESDPMRRVALVRKWKERPDFVSVNWGEDGAPTLASVLFEMGIGIEAGIWTLEDARRFVEGDFAKFCLRALVEPTVTRTSEALAMVEGAVATLADTGLPLVVHGRERTVWPVLRWAVAHGHGIRVGLEDTLELEGGRVAKDNAELVAAAKRLQG